MGPAWVRQFWRLRLQMACCEAISQHFLVRFTFVCFAFSFPRKTAPRRCTGISRVVIKVWYPWNITTGYSSQGHAPRPGEGKDTPAHPLPKSICRVKLTQMWGFVLLHDRLRTRHWMISRSLSRRTTSRINLHIASRFHRSIIIRAAKGMDGKLTDEQPASRKRRICDGCGRPSTTCLCSAMSPQPLSLQGHVIILR